MKEKSNRILLFSTAYLPFVGGAELALKEITDRINDVEFDLITARSDREFPEQERMGNISVYRVGFGFPSDKWLLPVLGFFKTLTLASRNKYDAFHAYQASYGAGAAYLAKFIFKNTPFIVTLQEGKDLDKQSLVIRSLRRLILEKADRATAISHYLKKHIHGISPDLSVAVIPNGVDLQKFKIKNEKLKINIRKELNIGEEDPVVITASRLVQKNGIGDLISAMALVCNVLPRARLLIAGKGSLENGLKLKVKSFNLENNVIFLGEVSHYRLSEYLAASDVFCRPSLSEGLGSAFLEAMATGTPVIGTLAGGISDFLIHGETGIACSAGDPDDISKKLLDVLTNEDLRSRLENRGSFLVRDKYSWDKIAAKFSQLYSEL